MKKWWVFSSYEDARQALELIDDLYRDSIKAFSSSAVVDGRILGRNAKTSAFALSKTKTRTWAEPQQTIDGRWAIPDPQSRHPSLVADFSQGILSFEEISDSEGLFPLGSIY